ncbi:MAG: serine hydrolase [Spirochaetales bacterium]|nr:serine hydrolase [Spirochaetales bacterium]
MAGDVYTVPEDLTPVSSWSEGFTAEEAEYFRNAYSAGDFIAGNDTTAYANMNITEILTTAVVARAGAVSELEVTEDPGVEGVIAKTDLGTMPLADAMTDPRSRMQGMIVVHQGRIVYENYPGMPSESRHLWNSASKTITGLLMHQLADEGLVDLKQPVSEYLGFTSGSPIGAILVEDVLHHRSGLDFEENQENFQNSEHALGKILHSAMTPRGVPRGAGVKESVIEVLPAKDPNTAFEYSTFNTQVLGAIIEEVTGQPWHQVVSQRIWSKAGMEGDAYLGLSSANEGLYGGIFASTLRDFARYALLFTPSYNAVSDTQVVPDNYFQTVYDAVNTEIYDKAFQGQRMIKAFNEDDALMGSAYQWDAVFSDGDLYKAGLGGQAIYVSPETDTAVVYFSTTWQNSLSMISYARAIVNEFYR